MKINVKQVLSLFTIVLFIWFGFACDDDYDDYEHPPCDPIEEGYWEMGYFTCNTIEYTDKMNEFTLDIKDKVTGEAIPGIYVKVSFNLYAMDTIHCSGQCFGLLQWTNIDEWGAYEMTTDANGQINNLTGIARYWDARDVQIVNFRIEDLSGKYSSKLTSIKYYYSTGPQHKTIYLLNNELL